MKGSRDGTEPSKKSMVVHRSDHLTSLRHLPSWALLAFSAGAVNAGALFACQRYVAHLTGTLTRIGADAGQLLAVDYFLVFASFILGAGSAVILVKKTPPTEEGAPSYWIPLSLVSLIVSAVAIAGSLGAFGKFGGTVETAHDFVFLCILSFAMGMQNAAVAVSTGMAVRTTHMTGPATDLAVAIATLLTGEAKERAGAIDSIKLRGTKLAAFALGAAAMVPLCSAAGFLAFLLPAVGCAIATVSSFAPSRIVRSLRA